MDEVQSPVQRLIGIHDEIRQGLGLADVTRIAIALYDAKTHRLKTFIRSGLKDSPLDHYTANLDDIPSLVEVVRQKRPRVVDDLDVFKSSPTVHSTRLIKHGFRSSLTVPIFDRGNLFGFLFFNSETPGCFSPVVVHQLLPYARTIALFAINDMQSIRMLQAAVKTAREITHLRDDETGGHLDRMARYSRLTALNLAAKYGFDDEFVEYIYQFAPLHDIGKVGIPDAILLKPGRLTESEFAIMREHVDKGITIIDAMRRDFNLDTLSHLQILRNIVAFHHEAIDGSGYPKGLKGDDIPIEARIISVADVFDALTSARPYKHAWTSEAAFEFLHGAKGSRFDHDCIEALEAGLDEIKDIQAQFAESPLG
ncbi:MAG: HD domain-containing protein [Alphaproteobacteria bacterium]|nr:HD domain-containing protein [Alphaproteobacteria bacterium]